MEVFNFSVEQEFSEQLPLLLKTSNYLLIIQLISEFNSGKSIHGMVKPLGFTLKIMLFSKKCFKLQMVNKFVDKEVTGMNIEKTLILNLATTITQSLLSLLPTLMNMPITNPGLSETSSLMLSDVPKNATPVNMVNLKMNVQVGNSSNGPGLKTKFHQKDGLCKVVMIDHIPVVVSKFMVVMKTLVLRLLLREHSIYLPIIELRLS